MKGVAFWAIGLFVVFLVSKISILLAIPLGVGLMLWSSRWDA